MDARTIERRAAMLKDALRSLNVAGPTGPGGPLVLAECSIRSLEEVAPQHAMPADARAAVSAFAPFVLSMHALRVCGSQPRGSKQRLCDSVEAKRKRARMKRMCCTRRSNVRTKWATTAGRLARAGENVPRTARPSL